MQNNIQFVLDGKIVSLDFQRSEIQPTTTVLNYLRDLPTHKGVKESCAEGDCGACTVVLGEVASDGKIHYKNVDSCLVFLPMLHGKQLVTVENLKSESGELHPVQTAMVETAGSQCGFCTPGFIMSLFSLYKNKNNPTRNEIDDSLTGNLCRCTGYKPIIEAAAKSCVNDTKDNFTNDEPQTAKLLKSISNESIHIQTTKQNYFQPTSLNEAIELKNKFPEAIVISGATDVALRVTKKHELLKEIIDLSRVEELKTFSESKNEMKIGSGISLEEVKQKTENDFPALFEMLSVFGSQQIRNLATLGGNLGTASPIGDTLPVLLAYNAIIELQSVNGKREVALDDYFIAYRKTARKENELITSITIPKLTNGITVKSYKISKRKDLDISTVSGGFRLELNEKNEVKEIKLCFGGMAEKTKRATATENFLLGKNWNRETIEQAMKILEKEFTPISDARSGAEFRTIASRNLLLKFYTETK
jgi:xanthine dehydrogenase small subunit